MRFLKVQWKMIKETFIAAEQTQKVSVVSFINRDHTLFCNIKLELLMLNPV